MTDKLFGFTLGERVIMYQPHWPSLDYGVVTGTTENRQGTRIVRGLAVRADNGVDMDMPKASVLHDTPSALVFVAGVGKGATTSVEGRRLLWDLHRDNAHLLPNVAALPRP